MKEKLSERSFELVILILSIAAAIILEHLLGSLFGGHFDFVQVSIVCALMIPPVIIAVLAYSWLVDRTLKVTLDRLVLRIPDNVLSYKETQGIERDSGHIWVITTDFFWDIRNDFSRDVVTQNIKAGKRYRYFCPDTDSSRNSIAEICRTFPETHSIEMVSVPSDHINVLLFEYVIYDAKTSKQQGILVDLFGKRYSRPEETVDMLLDSQNVLPKFVDLAETWSKNFHIKNCPGTHGR